MYIQLMKQSQLDSQKEIVSLPCACANLRRAARIVSQQYEHKIRPAGIKGTQFTLLQTLSIAANISQGQLSDLLGIDSTTLTRTLALLRKKSWITAKRGKDRREIRLALTAEGKRKYQKALPYWQSAQTELRRALGEAGWKQIMESTIFAAAMSRAKPSVPERNREIS